MDGRIRVMRAPTADDDLVRRALPTRAAPSASPADLAGLPRLAGNRAMAALVQRSRRAARMPAPRAGATATVQCACCTGCATGGPCQDESEAVAGDTAVDRAAETGSAPGTPAGGQALPPTIRADMEARLGTDLGSVRIHDNPTAGASALEMGARAYTVGNDISFAPGQYAPDSEPGRRLLAHELTHVVQQRSAMPTVDLASSRPTGSAAALEDEADQVARSMTVSRRRSPVVPRGVAGPQLSLFSDVTDSIGEGLGDLGEMLSGLSFEALAQRALQAAGSDPLIAEAAALRDGILQAGQPVSLTHEIIQSIAGLRAALATGVPSWVPLPALRIQPAAQGELVIAGITITAAMLALILLMFILILWVLLRANPDIRKAQDKAVEDLLRKIRESTQPRREPDRPPTPDRPPVPPLGPDVDADTDEDEDERTGCRIRSVAMRFGRVPCHADFARTFSGVRREFDVTTPEGLTAEFDARDLTGTFFEVKTGYGWYVNQNLTGEPWDSRRRQVRERFVDQAVKQETVADRCDLPLEWWFNNPAVAAEFDGLVPPPVHSRRFNCETDSDHTW